MPLCHKEPSWASKAPTGIREPLSLIYLIYFSSYCNSNAYCVNQEGWTAHTTYKCECHTGYEAWAAHSGCRDINECCNKAEWNTPAHSSSDSQRWRIMMLLMLDLICHKDILSPCLYGIRFSLYMEATYHAITTHRKAEKITKHGAFVLP